MTLLIRYMIIQSNNFIQRDKTRNIILLSTGARLCSGEEAAAKAS
jgi:hypothetical protein